VRSTTLPATVSGSTDRSSRSIPRVPRWWASGAWFADAIISAFALALEFLTDQVGNLGIEIAETFVQDAHADAPFIGVRNPEYQIVTN
jgi:hypothetical protein